MFYHKTIYIYRHLFYLCVIYCLTLQYTCVLSLLSCYLSVIIIFLFIIYFTFTSLKKRNIISHTYFKYHLKQTAVYYKNSCVKCSDRFVLDFIRLNLDMIEYKPFKLCMKVSNTRLRELLG
jgi:hypothetical protein